MDTIQIGKFLAQLRKERGLTQEQLGEQLGVTNKTVSRWEKGNYLPPVDVLLLLSDLYGITINELLSGQRLTEETFQEKAEENLKAVLAGRPSGFTLEEKKRYFAQKWQRDHRFERIAMPVLAFAVILAGAYCQESGWILLGTLGGLAYSVVERNRRMAYIEAHAYDGTGPGE